MKTKVCQGCLKSLLITEFWKDSRLRSGRCSRCRSCKSKENLRWRSAHREERKIYQSRYSREHRERTNERLRIWRKRNIHRAREIYRSYRSRNIERVRDRDRKREKSIKRAAWYLEYYSRTRSRQLSNARRWRLKNRERHNLNSLNYRKRKLGATGEFSALQWKEMKILYAFKCLRCKKREPEISLTLDHIVPLSKGGSHTKDNIQPLCGPCNSAKSTRSTDYRPASTRPA